MSYENIDKYYVYAYLRDNGTPYYIGKGQGKRAYTKYRGEVYPPANKSLIKFIAHKLWENEAFLLETKLIRKFGRQDLGTGILRNKSDGGEGTKAPYSKVAWNKGLTKDTDSRVAANAAGISKGMKRYKRTPEHQANLSESLKGRGPPSEESKEKARRTLRITLARKKLLENLNDAP